MEITARNTNQLQPLVYRLLQEQGHHATSRNGPVLRFLEPVTVQLTHPWERVNFCPHRHANPFFHLMEALAMLGGLNSVDFMVHFAKNMANYSDDGRTYNSFYGTRLIHKWGNQLAEVIKHLRATPDSRQEVALIWDPFDLDKPTKDKACNLMLLFSIHPITQKLEMTSFNRSNDAIWGGVNGANIVHLSFFQEYVACCLGRAMGSWFHVSNNLHVYTENPQWERIKNVGVIDHYTTSPKFSDITHVPLFRIADDEVAFDVALDKFLVRAMEAIQVGWALDGFPQFPFLNDASIIFNVWQKHKTKRFGSVDLNNELEKVLAKDWRIACQAWVTRTYFPKEDSPQ